jgi:HD-GYP domain-containing protein (c-di-GMP phosphodiesterase class II)
LGGSTSHIALRFGLISVLAAALVSGLSGFEGWHIVKNFEQHAAARSANRLVGAPVRAALDGLSPASSGAPLSSSAREQLDALTAPLLSADLRAVRLWTPDGEVAYQSGSDAGTLKPPPLQGAAQATARGTAGDGTPIYSAYSSADGYVLEIALDARPLEKIDASQQTMILEIAVVYVALCVLLQFGFWFATRTVSAEHRHLAQLFASGEELRSSLDLHDVISQLVREATVMGRGRYGAVVLFEPETGDLMLRATYDHATGTISHHQRSVEEWFLRRAVITTTTIVSAQSAKVYEQFFGPEVDKFQQVNVMCVPMALRDRVVGVLGIVRVPDGRRGTFAPRDVRHTLDLAAQGATAIEQALLFAKVRSYAKEVEVSYDSTLKALVAALDAKDEVTEGHGERVAKLTSHLARQMGVAENAIVDMERGALLHDVGKIGVPDAVLNKPAALNDMEWEAMRKHPLLAGMMIAKVGFLEGATPILLYHHERWDGTGYPFGLARTNIPFDARIFSVVDAYGAMTSDRPYRDAKSHDEAMAEIAAGSGTQFDPAVVVAFQRLISARPELRTRPAAARKSRHAGDFSAKPHPADSSVA